MCTQCRLGVLQAVGAFCSRWAPHVQVFTWQVDCLVKVNERQWDVRWKEYEDEIVYCRLSIRWSEQQRADPDDDGDADVVGDDDAALSSPGWSVECAQLQDDSGVYAINTSSNVPWTNPIPPSPASTHPR